MENFESFKNRINLELNAAKNDLMNGQQLIKKHCDQLKTQQGEQNRLINEFEADALKAFSNSNMEKFLNKLDEIRTVVENLDETQEKAYFELSHQLARLAVERENIIAFIFNGKLIESRNMNIELRSFYSIEFSHLNKFDFSPHFEMHKKKYAENYGPNEVFLNVIGFGCLKTTGRLLAVVRFHDNKNKSNLNMFLFEQTRGLIKEIQLENVLAGDLQIYQDKICFMYYTLENKSMLRILNENLDTLNEIEAVTRGLIGVSDECIFVTPEKKSNNSSSKLTCYDWSLNKLNKLKHQKYLFVGEIFNLISSNGKYYFIEYEHPKFSLKIVNIIDGNLIKSISIKSCSSFQIDSNGNVVVYDGYKLVYLSHFGEVLNMIKLCAFPEPDTSRWCMDHLNNLYLFEEDTLCLSVKYK